MSAEGIKALARHFIDEFNKGKTAAMVVIDELCTTDFVWHPSTGKDIGGLKDFKRNTNEVYSAIPDAHFNIDDMVVEGDRVAMRWIVTGTHKGEFMGIPPTNKKVTSWGIEIYRIAGGKFVDLREMRSGVRDFLKLRGPASSKWVGHPAVLKEVRRSRDRLAVY